MISVFQVRKPLDPPIEYDLYVTLEDLFKVGLINCFHFVGGLNLGNGMCQNDKWGLVRKASRSSYSTRPLCEFRGFV